VKNSMIFGQPAGEPRGLRPFAAAPGTSLRGGLVGSLAGTSGDLILARPRPHELKLSVMPQVTCTNYNSMPRIAANGGDVSGSHPAWDPV
jgi:hypothetical protein